MNYPQEKRSNLIATMGKERTGRTNVRQHCPCIRPVESYSIVRDRPELAAKGNQLAQTFRPQQIMDVATGTGDFAILACHELQPEQLIGTDISEGMMNVGREKVKRKVFPKKYLLQGKTVPLSFADNRFRRYHRCFWYP